jgi:hypothetical protein
MTNINNIAKSFDVREINKLSYVYKTIKFGGSTEEEIIRVNGTEYALTFGGKHITLEQAATILRFYDLMSDMC